MKVNRMPLSAAFCFFVLTGCGAEREAPQNQSGESKPAKLAFSDNPWFDFGLKNVGTRHEKVISVTNTGEMLATQMRGSFYLSVHFSFKGGSYPGSGGSCSDNLLPGDVCEVVVEFAPQYSGHFEQPITLLFFDGAASQKAIGPYLRGDGI